MSLTATEAQNKVQSLSTEYQQLEAELSTVVEARQKLDAQLKENELVKKEFQVLKPENTVYKLIGPVLVKQEQAEAKSNVETRLEFIRGEIKRVEAQIEDLTAKTDKKKNEIVSIQAAFQQQQQQQQQKTAVKA